MRLDIVEMNIFVPPFEVVDDPFVSELFLDNEDVLEEVYDPLLDIEVVKLSNHGLLVLQILLILVDQGIPLIYH